MIKSSIRSQWEFLIWLEIRSAMICLRFLSSFTIIIMRGGGCSKDGAIRPRNIRMKCTKLFFSQERRPPKVGHGLKNGKSILMVMSTLRATSMQMTWLPNSNRRQAFQSAEEGSGSVFAWNFARNWSSDHNSNSCNVDVPINILLHETCQ
jgi:hypothetical protein